METTEKTVKESTESTVKAPDKIGLHPYRALKKSATWQRITISLLGILIEVGIWQWATWHLYSLPPTSISSFTTITVNCFYVIGSMVVFFVTGKLIYDLKVDTVASVITEGKASFEQKKEDITKTINYNEHIIEEGQGGAPLNKPFGQAATHEDGYDE